MLCLHHGDLAPVHRQLIFPLSGPVPHAGALASNQKHMEQNQTGVALFG